MDCFDLKLSCACCFLCNSHFCAFILWVLAIAYLVYNLFAHDQVHDSGGPPTRSPSSSIQSDDGYENYLVEIMKSLVMATMGLSIALVMVKFSSRR